VLDRADSAWRIRAIAGVASNMMVVTMKLLVFAILAVPAIARGQGAPAAATTEPGAVWLGGGIDLGVGTTVTTQVGTQSASASLDTGFGLMMNGDYQIDDLFTVRVMPRYVGNVKFSNTSGDSGHAYDLRAGGTIGKDISPTMRGYGLLALGYFKASFPASTMIPDAGGATLTIGGGLTSTLAPNLRLYVEGSYERGFQSIAAGGMSTDFHFSGLEFGAGVQAALGR
jgi:hypothetical protein